MESERKTWRQFNKIINDWQTAIKDWRDSRGIHRTRPVLRAQAVVQVVVSDRVRDVKKVDNTLNGNLIFNF